MSATILLLVVSVICVLLYVPIGFSIGLGALAVVFFTRTFSSNLIFSTMFASGDSFPLLAVPFFILSGDIMANCGISKRLVNFARTYVGHVNGGMGIVCVIACMFFAAISGSGVATAAAIGGIMIPIMIQERYDEGFTCSLLSMASAIGPIIPPSVPFILYAIVCDVSVIDIFAAGFVPGILMGIAMSIVVYWQAKKHGYGKKTARSTRKEKWEAFLDAKWSLAMPVIMLGGIYFGIFTPTESAVISCVYSLIIGFFVYKELKFSELVKIAGRATASMGQIMALLVFANVFGKLLLLNNIPQRMADYVMSVTDSRIIVLLLVNIVLIIAGMFLDTLCAIAIFGPLLLAVLKPYGVTALHFGVIMAVNLAIGLSTPPVGASLYIASGIAKLPVEKTFRSLVPLLIANTIVLLMITYIEPLVTFMPALLRSIK